MKEGKIVQPAQLGIQVKPAEGDEPGAIVEKVMPDSAAAKAGIQENDRIVTFAGQPIAGPQELRAAVGGYVAGDKVEVVIKRKDMSIKVEATLDAAKAPEAPKPELPFKLPIPRER
jgi:S1-C subfamily serine protease